MWLNENLQGSNPKTGALVTNEINNNINKIRRVCWKMEQTEALPDKDEANPLRFLPTLKLKAREMR